MVSEFWRNASYTSCAIGSYAEAPWPFLVEREEIALERARGTGVRAIARKLGRSPSTISREIRRNSATRSGEFDYRATAAQWHADRAAKRPKIKLGSQPRPARLRSGSAVGPHCNTGRHRLRWPRRGMERTARRSPTKPALVICLESGADRAAPEGGLPQGSDHAHQIRSDLPSALHPRARGTEVNRVLKPLSRRDHFSGLLKNRWRPLHVLACPEGAASLRTES